MKRAILIKKVIPAKETEIIFSGAIIHKMLETIGNTLKSLAIRLTVKSGHDIIIADLIDDFVPRICNLLCLYSVNHLARLQAISNHKKNNPDLVSLLDRIQQASVKISLNKSLEELFQSVITRLDIYAPLFSQLSLISPKTSYDYPYLQEALSTMSFAQDFINYSKTKQFQFISRLNLIQPSIVLYEVDLYKRMVSKPQLATITIADKLKLILMSDAILLTYYDTEVRKKVYYFSESFVTISDPGLETAIKFANTILYTLSRTERDMLLYHYNKLKSLLSSM